MVIQLVFLILFGIVGFALAMTGAMQALESGARRSSRILGFLWLLLGFGTMIYCMSTFFLWNS